MKLTIGSPVSCCLLALTLACDLSTRQAPAKPPVARVEINEGQAIVDLAEGVSARSIVGSHLFGDFLPGWTPEEAEERFGKPTEVSTTDYLTLFIYERQGKRVAIARQTVLQSGGGPPGTSLELRAFPPAGYLETLPESLRDLIRSEPRLREIHLGSGLRDDWRIRLILRDGQVSYVSARAAPPLRDQRERQSDVQVQAR
jgi:hypothetical protein